MMEICLCCHMILNSMKAMVGKPTNCINKLDHDVRNPPLPNQWILSSPTMHPSIRFPGNKSSSFCIILLRPGQTKHNLLDSDNKIRLMAKFHMPINLLSSYPERYELNPSAAILLPSTLFLNGRNTFSVENCKLSRYFPPLNLSHSMPINSSHFVLTALLLPLSSCPAGLRWIIQPTTYRLLETITQVSYSRTWTVGPQF